MNMSYCRFRNTLTDLDDCIEALQQNVGMSRDEARAAKAMLRHIVTFLEEAEIIDDYDDSIIDELIDALTD